MQRTLLTTPARQIQAQATNTLGLTTYTKTILHVCLNTGLFANEYTEWTARTTANKTWLAMKMFWPPNIHL